MSGRLDVLQLPEDRPPVATRLNRQLPRQDSHLQERATFARRTLTKEILMPIDPMWSRRLRDAFDDRPRHGLTQAGLAEAVQSIVGMAETGRPKRGSTVSGIRLYLKGKVAKPRPEILRAMAEALRVPERWLLYGERSRTEPEEVSGSTKERVYWIDKTTGWPESFVENLRERSVVAKDGSALAEYGLLELLGRIRFEGEPDDGENSPEPLWMADWITRHLRQPLDLFYPEGEWDIQQQPYRDYLTIALHALSLIVPKTPAIFWPPWAAISLLKSVEELVRWDWPIAIPGTQKPKPLGELVPEELGVVMDLVYDAARLLPVRVEAVREKVRKLHKELPNKCLKESLPLEDLRWVCMLRMLLLPNEDIVSLTEEEVQALNDERRESSRRADVASQVLDCLESEEGQAWQENLLDRTEKEDA